MSVREYIGARYVPVFADPIQWDPTSIYEPLTVVTDQGASYVSRRYVPEGIQLNNGEYWVLWADFNAQLQHYIDEVEAFDGRIDAVEAKFPVDTNDIADDAITAAKIDDGAVETATLASASVTNEKLATDAVTTSKIADNTIPFTKLVPTLQTRINTLESDPRYMVIIGDSFSYSAGGYTETPYWWEYVQRRCGITAKNYAQGGCGYTVGTKTFITQANEAVADTSYDHKRVKYCVVLGGVNDHGAYNSTLVNAVVQALINEFTNAKILVAFNTGRARDDSNTARQSVFEWLAKSGTPHCSIACVENIDGAIQSSDSIHPTTSGSALIADYISANLGIGTFDYIGNAWNIPINSGNALFSVLNRQIKIVGDELHVALRIKQTGDPSYQTCKLTFPTIIGTEYNGAWYRKVMSKFTSVNGHANVLSDGSFLVAQDNNALAVTLNPSDVNATEAQFNIDFNVKLY